MFFSISKLIYLESKISYTTAIILFVFITLTIQSLSFDELMAPFASFNDKMIAPQHDFLTLQPRLKSVLDDFLNAKSHCSNRFLLIKGDDEPFFHRLLADYLKTKMVKNDCQKVCSFHYQITARSVQLIKNHPQGNFSTDTTKETYPVKSACLFYPSQLFGFVRQPENGLMQIEQGLLHQANGGVLILSLTQLLEQPDCFKLLKQSVYSESFQWLSPDPAHPYPLAIPDLPLDVKVILIDDRYALSELQLIDPYFFNQCFYGEFEATYTIKKQTYDPWIAMMQFLVFELRECLFDPSAFILLVQEGMKECEDQERLPCSPSWLNQLLKSLPESVNPINATQLQMALQQAKWQLDYLPSELLARILEKQVTIYTEGELIGQINGLSVVEYPGYPKEIGEPSRISCVLALGEGDIIDIERKTELGGNLHSKGMMIIQSLLDKEFAQQRHLPFDFSLVFEQSYNEIDGDSASLAGFCALLSALANLPINQQFAITGSIDQNGNVQAIGGLTQKIEGFFNICAKRGLTGKQAVIIPEINQSQLCLNEAVLDAIKKNQFAIFTVTHFSEAIELLTELPYDNSSPFNLKAIIRARLNQTPLAGLQPKKSFFSWFSFNKT